MCGCTRWHDVCVCAHVCTCTEQLLCSKHWKHSSSPPRGYSYWRKTFTIRNLQSVWGRSQVVEGGPSPRWGSLEVARRLPQVCRVWSWGLKREKLPGPGAPVGFGKLGQTLWGWGILVGEGGKGNGTAGDAGWLESSGPREGWQCQKGTFVFQFKIKRNRNKQKMLS